MFLVHFPVKGLSLFSCGAHALGIGILYMVLLAAGITPRAMADTGGLDDSKAIALENITVTANKMEEELKDVPQSITVIDEYMLEEKGIKNVADVINEIPNMSIINSMGSLVNFRGLNMSMFTYNNPVVIYIDGVPYSDRFGFDASMANVERVEVLRGPQGTIYGKDAIGAVINVVTKQPGETWHGKIGTEYGSNNLIQGLFNLNGPLVKGKLYAGINGQYQQDDGWIKNLHSGMDTDANEEYDRKTSGYLLYKPTDRFNARLTFSNDEVEKNWIDGYGLPGIQDFSKFHMEAAEEVDFDVPTLEETESNAQSLNLTYDFDVLTLTSVTTHRKLESDAVYDVDFGNAPLYAGLTMSNDFGIDTWAHELRFSSSNNEGLRWIGGFYIDSESRDQYDLSQQFPNFDPSTLAFLGNFEMNGVSSTETDTRAAFGQGMIPLGDQFELTLGGRYQRIEKEIDLDMYYLPVGMTGDPMFEFKEKKSWDVFLPKAALAYKLNIDWSPYLSWSKGYMPGGYNYFAMSGTSEENSFDPQQSTNYELGIKGSYRDIRVAASIFRMEIEEIHVYKMVGNMLYTDNAEKGHSHGAELELIYLPLEGLELTGSLGLIEAEYDDYDAGTVRFDGQKIQHTPSHTARIGVAYNHPKGFYTRLDVQHQGEIYLVDDAKSNFIRDGSHTLADMKIGYRLSDWEAYCYVKNLTDEEYVTRFMSSSTSTFTSFGDPRTMGLGLCYRF